MPWKSRLQKRVLRTQYFARFDTLYGNNIPHKTSCKKKRVLAALATYSFLTRLVKHVSTLRRPHRSTYFVISFQRAVVVELVDLNLP